MTSPESDSSELRAAAIFGLLIATAINLGWLFTLWPQMGANPRRVPIAAFIRLFQSVGSRKPNSYRLFFPNSNSCDCLLKSRLAYGTARRLHILSLLLGGQRQVDKKLRWHNLHRIGLAACHKSGAVSCPDSKVKSACGGG